MFRSVPAFAVLRPTEAMGTHRKISLLSRLEYGTKESSSPSAELAMMNGGWWSW